MALEVVAGSGLGSELVENAGTKLNVRVGPEMAMGVESAAGVGLGMAVGAGSNVRVGFKACLRGRPLRRGKVGAGLGMGVASREELWVVGGVASEAG